MARINIPFEVQTQEQAAQAQAQERLRNLMAAPPAPQTGGLVGALAGLFGHPAVAQAGPPPPPPAPPPVSPTWARPTTSR